MGHYKLEKSKYTVKEGERPQDSLGMDSTSQEKRILPFILEKYHAIFWKKMRIDLLNRCYRIIFELLKHWSKKGIPVPRSVLKYESVSSLEYKRLRDAEQAFGNNLALLKKLELIINVRERGYEPNESLIERWRGSD